MTDPLATLINCVAQLDDLDMAQEWIDNARKATPTNLIVQQSLNRQQLALDLRRAQIEELMLIISTNN